MRTILQIFRESVVRAKAKSGLEPEGKMAFANPKFQGVSSDDGREEDLKKEELQSTAKFPMRSMWI
jgi:hypothetical protein